MPQSSPAPAPNTVIDGRWRLIERLGRGAMGDIWRAAPLGGTHDRFALKLLHRTLEDDPELVARFEREIEVTRRIEHPNAVRIRGGGRACDGQMYFVMDEIRGRSLSAIAATEAPVEPLRVACIGRQIASALGAAHAVGVVHRDLKPENVMVSRVKDEHGQEQDHVVVFDFGLSITQTDGARAGGSRLTAHDLRIGTPGYMAPEYLIDGLADERSDLYALGVVLYELASGTLPFAGPPYRVLQQQASREVPPLAERCSVPDWLSDAIHRLLRREPKERPASADAAVKLLTAPSPGRTVARP